MNVLYDHQIFQMQKVGGISRYFCEIIERAEIVMGVHKEVALNYSQNVYARQSGFSNQAAENPDSYENFLHPGEFKGKWSLYKWRNRLRKPIDTEAENQRTAIEALQRQDFDVFHPTYYDVYFLPYIQNKPFVLTVYDMIHEIYPEYFNLADQTSKQKRELAQRAAKIIAISECTKRDLINLFGIPEQKIKVIHLANSEGLNPATAQPPQGLPKKYLLFVGSRSEYKNFYFFINSITSLLEADCALHVVCVGSPFNRNEKTFFAHLGLTARVHAYSVSDSELGVLYTQAQAFVFPSLYEGFGLPVLEAFAAKCPVVCSSSGSLPEVGERAALYFQPKDGASIRTAIRKVMSEDETRMELIERGTERLASLSWDRTAHLTGDVYQEVHLDPNP